MQTSLCVLAVLSIILSFIGLRFIKIGVNRSYPDNAVGITIMGFGILTISHIFSSFFYIFFSILRKNDTVGLIIAVSGILLPILLYLNYKKSQNWLITYLLGPTILTISIFLLFI